MILSEYTIQNDLYMRYINVLASAPEVLTIIGNRARGASPGASQLVAQRRSTLELMQPYSSHIFVFEDRQWVKYICGAIVTRVEYEQTVDYINEDLGYAGQYSIDARFSQEFDQPGDIGYVFAYAVMTDSKFIC